MSNRTCSVATCDKPHSCRGLCSTHYARQRLRDNRRPDSRLKSKNDPAPLSPEDAARERWRAIPGYEGWYEVSDLGRVRSLDRIGIDKSGRRIDYDGKILRLTSNRNGYLSVGLKRCGDRRQCEVQGLVLKAFVGKRLEGMVCRHLDGNPGNNHLENLAWGTLVENSADIDRHGRRPFQDRCHRRHPLVPPNLERGHAKRGHRSCLACSRARAILRKIGTTDERGVLADLLHTAIVNGELNARRSADRAIVLFFLDEIGRVYRALERHLPDAHGHCEGCQTQSFSAIWPCRICRLAVAARNLHEARVHAAEKAADYPTQPMRAVTDSGRHRTPREAIA